MQSFTDPRHFRIAYHWSELWRCILSLIRFLSSYAADLKDLPGIHIFIDDLVNLIALALSAGDAFLPGAGEYDDLFYKLVEAGDVLVKFRDNCMFRHCVQVWLLRRMQVANVHVIVQMDLEIAPRTPFQP